MSIYDEKYLALNFRNLIISKAEYRKNNQQLDTVVKLQDPKDKNQFMMGGREADYLQRKKKKLTTDLVK